jgi:hypothetical protein
MAQPLMSNAAVMLPQEEKLGSVTPAMTPAPVPTPGVGMVSSKASVGPDSPPNFERSRGPMPGDGTIPMPKPNAAPGETPMPKYPGTVDSATPMPKPRPQLMGSGTAPSAPSTTAGLGVASVGDWRAGFSETDRAAVTRSVQDSELTSKQLSRLIDENGRYIQQARLGAREGAASRGMLTSSFAAGAAERAAIDAAMPIAQADANTYFSTSSENMAAQNQDAMQDQAGGRQLLGQDIGLRANASESALNRQFQSSENEVGRQFQSSEAATERGWRSTEAGRDRDQQTRLEDLRRQFEASQNEQERARLREAMNNEMAFNREQGDLTRQQQRVSEYNNLMANREAQLSQQLSAIFSNTNMKPEEQARAAENARAVFTSTTASFNAAFAQGVPSIFMRPYEMQQPAPGTQPTTPVAPTTPAGTGLQPGFTPIPGTDLASGPGGVIRRAIDVALARG